MRRTPSVKSKPKSLTAGRSAEDSLTALAEQILTANLERFGNTLAPKHLRALTMILSTLTTLATEKPADGEVRRYAADLDCGGGKSEAIIAWCAAVEKLGLPYSVA